MTQTVAWATSCLSSTATRLPLDPRDKSIRRLPVACRGLPDAIHEPPHIAVGLGQQLEASQLRAERTLEQLGGRQAPLLQRPMQVVREIRLNPRRTPNVRTRDVSTNRHASRRGRPPFFPLARAALALASELTRPARLAK